MTTVYIKLETVECGACKKPYLPMAVVKLHHPVEDSAKLYGWLAVPFYGVTLYVCPTCARNGEAFTFQIKKLSTLLALRAIVQTDSLERAKEMALQAIREGEKEL